jgi:cold shock protein
MESPLSELTVRGQVKWFNALKGYGFILDQEGREFFVHFSEIDTEGFRTLQDGDLVEFTPRNCVKGLAAHKVRKIAPQPIQEPRPPIRLGGSAVPAPATVAEVGAASGARRRHSNGSHIRIDAGANAQTHLVTSAAANFCEIGRLLQGGEKAG